MAFSTGKLVIDTPDDAVELISLLFQKDRPTAEILAALDEHAALLPEGYDRVRRAVAAGNRAAANMQIMVALDPRPR